MGVYAPLRGSGGVCRCLCPSGGAVRGPVGAYVPLGGEGKVSAPINPMALPRPCEVFF